MKYSIVGMRHRGTGDLVAQLERGETISLEREYDNPHDRNAVRVMARDVHIGFIRAEQAKTLAPILDAGEGKCTAKFTRSRDGWPLAETEGD